MTDHTRTEKIGGDSIYFVIIQVEQKTVMTENIAILHYNIREEGEQAWVYG